MGRFRRFGRFLGVIVVGGVGVGACLAALLPAMATVAEGSHYTGKVAPGLSKLPQRTIVYDSHGAVLDVLGLQDRQPVRLSEVPKVLINAVIATEDKTFYENPGVDFRSIARAFTANIGSGSLEQGGSTITQQLIKNRYFKNPKRDLDRKVKEVALAVRLNDEWPKTRILEEYLNTVYFGEGSYGIKSAVERFFDGESLQKVDLAQAALLAGVISNPDGYNPFTNPDQARRRRAVVLKRMVDQHYITQAEETFANALPLPTKQPTGDLSADNYYVEQVKNQLLADHRLGATYTERFNHVFLGGLKVYTAYDPRLQFLAQSAVSTTLPDSRFTAAMVVMDPRNGEVRAIVAGPGLERSKLNLATQAVRQPGSTMKAVTLATLLENGYSPNDSVNGTSPCTIHPPGVRVDPAHPLRTRNAESGGGTMSVRSATTNSVNCAFFRLGAAVGPAKISEMAKRLGITHTMSPNIYINAIGSGDGASPLDMATAFSVFAGDGIRHDPLFVTRVEDADGHLIFDEREVGVRVLDPQIARTVTDLLTGVVKSGTGTRAQIPGRDVAGKTGTTDNAGDAWFNGFTPQLVATVWMGDPNAVTPMRNVGRFGEVFGGTYPAMIWQKFMSAALQGLPVLRFTEPDRALWPAGRYVDENGRGRPTAGNTRTETTTTLAPDTTTTSATTGTTTPTLTVPPPPGPDGANARGGRRGRR